MTAHPTTVTLSDKYELDRGTVYMTGIQALLRIGLDQIRADRARGHKTGGFYSGYRGSPLGGLDKELGRAHKLLDAHDIVFQPGVNEELGATAVWGTQKVGLHGQGSTHEGVFGIWYGKAPGVDRASDALKQANASGTAPLGGCLALCGDDHLAKSSILPAQSEYTLLNFEMPILNPSDLQDVLDYGLYGLAMSRFSGLWTGILCLADTMDSSGLVSVDPERLAIVTPQEHDPRAEADVNRVLLLKNRLETERVLREHKIPAAQAFVRANGLDRVAFGSHRPRYGIVTTGKAYRDLRQALELLGIDEEKARGIGLAVFKVAMPWPLEPSRFSAFARGLDRLMVVEHKRAFMEPQIKDLLYGWPQDQRPRIWGKKTPDGAPFLSDLLELQVQELIEAVLAFVPEVQEDGSMRAVAERLVMQAAWAGGHSEKAQRTAYFCSGCPHSSSTVVPEGARAQPGIGCHAMTEINGRTSDGQIAMGGEGVLWVGQAPFSNDKHMFVNLGDGTYFHSGILAIRQAVAANAPITYKILFNDAVAMTGGQPFDGPLSVPQISRQLAAEGVEKIVVLSERPHLYEGRTDLAPGTPVHDRGEIMRVQEELADYPGVSAIIFDQTCAAEKRRRRKKGDYEDPDKRLFINSRVCEGCGDCSVQSNCIAVEPLETEFGQKRRINQSSCNKDYSCVKGFCPSFVWVEGADLVTAEDAHIDVEAMAAKLNTPRPDHPSATSNLVIAGIGGMGVTTVGAVLAMAGHIDGLNVSTLDMTGLAQKNGPVTSHVRFAPKGRDIEGPRVPAASLDVLLATDMLVACSADVLGLTERARTTSVANTRVAPTAEFVMKQTLSYQEARLKATLEEGSQSLLAIDAADLAERLLGDALYTNMILAGAAWQKGEIPLSFEAIETAIRLNGAAVEKNLKAFTVGRIAAADYAALAEALPQEEHPEEETLEQRIALLSDELVRYQGRGYAKRFRDLVARVEAADRKAGAGTMRLTRTVAENLYKVMAYKDEYEVARLYADPAFSERLKSTFKDPKRLSVMMAPPVISKTDPATGRPQKRAFGPWIFKAFRVLAAMKRLRGTPLDPFGHSQERRAERALVRSYRRDVETILEKIGGANYGLLVEIARVPDQIRGYGPVKEANREAAEKKRTALFAQLEAKDDGTPRGGEAHREVVLEAAE
ncbi:indolepyruvate ferredoxin oxidoreductase family protein [Amorphus sp. 3PC139-8]|uniref:indolepyruvate ferredoxin oxidoreductase family protein n=1 Tax=Amorphus sp. 3PC139-8 TaxID=2735676 RepID=UPI00345CFA7F